jgi:hypothetical protein
MSTSLWQASQREAANQDDAVLRTFCFASFAALAVCHGEEDPSPPFSFGANPIFKFQEGHFQIGKGPRSFSSKVAEG